MSSDIIASARLRARGRLFEDFTIGEVKPHHWGRTIFESDTVNFSVLTLSYNPLYTNRAYAKAHGHPDIVVNPQLLFNVVLGLSVEDCSEIGGPFLGVHDLVYHRQVYPGITLIAQSETVDARVSDSNPANGIVTWRTEGRDENGDLIVSFRRSNLVRLRHPISEKA